MDEVVGRVTSVATPHWRSTGCEVAAPEEKYATEIAVCESDVQAAQRLRYEVFANELGAQIPGAEAGLDRDPFDRYCDHLLVRHCPTGDVVGTYRILRYEQAKRAGGFYSANEFDLRRLTRLGPRVMEVGRACVHPAHRGGLVVSQLWAALFDYVRATGHEYVIGCGSISVAEYGRQAVSICNRLKQTRLGPTELRVFPYRPFPLSNTAMADAGSLPPLLKGYLRLGASVCGDPAWDQRFGTADVLLLLRVADIAPRYARGLHRRAQRAWG